MIQQILIGFFFIVALVYTGRLIYRSFQAKSNCATGCGKCGTLDIDKIEAALKAKKTI